MEKTPKNQPKGKTFRKQPILCPWISSQPYHSALWAQNSDPNTPEPTTKPWSKPQFQDKTVPSLQESSTQFFYFLRLMQLFPDTHPATIHTVLSLCKNDFFGAVDKLLYAKRCKLMCYGSANGVAKKSGAAKKGSLQSTARKWAGMVKNEGGGLGGKGGANEGAGEAAPPDADSEVVICLNLTSSPSTSADEDVKKEGLGQMQVEEMHSFIAENAEDLSTLKAVIDTEQSHIITIQK